MGVKVIGNREASTVFGDKCELLATSKHTSSIKSNPTPQGSERTSYRRLHTTILSNLSFRLSQSGISRVSSRQKAGLWLRCFKWQSSCMIT